MSPLFTGLVAFPLTPADAGGTVDADAVALLVDRLAEAGTDSIGLLGSTGTYAYLNRVERSRAVTAAIEAAGGRVPVIVGIGALRTTWSQELAADAERLGAAGLFMAPMSYTPLTQGEVAHHYQAVASCSDLPLCIYNNPSTTHFAFPDGLIAELAAVPSITAIKMPLPDDGNYAAELARLRKHAPDTFKIGYSGDWGAAGSLLAGGDAWYSVVAGLLPAPALRLTRAAQAGRTAEAVALDFGFPGAVGSFPGLRQPPDRVRDRGPTVAPGKRATASPSSRRQSRCQEGRDGACQDSSHLRFFGEQPPSATFNRRLSNDVAHSWRTAVPQGATALIAREVMPPATGTLQHAA